MARLLTSYGKMNTNTDYEVVEEGKDFYRFKNGTMVPKNLVTFERPKVVEEDEEDYSNFYNED